MPSFPFAFLFRRLALVLAVAGGGVACVRGAAAGEAIKELQRTDQYFFDTFDIDSGLPGVTVVNALQTQDGYLWIATGGGLARFDGVRFESFRPSTTPAFLSPLVYSLLEDRDHALWIGTSRGVVRYRNQQFERICLDESEVHSLAQDREGRIWMGTYRDGLFVWQNGHLQHCDDAALDGAHYILRLLVDSSGRLWIGSDQPGVVRVDGGSFHREEVPAALAVDRVEAICEQPAGTFWFGTRGSGVFRLRGSAWARYGAADGLVGPEVSDLQPSSDGSVLVVSGKAQRIADPLQPYFETIPDVPRDAIFSVYEDREGGIWYCAKERGLLRAEKMPYRLIAKTDGLPENGVRSIAQDAEGNLWLAIQGHGLAEIGSDGLVKPRVAGGAVPVVAIVAHDGSLWLGGPGPLRHRAAKGEESFPEVRNAYGLFEDRQRNVWIGTVSDGLFRYDGTRFIPVVAAGNKPIQRATWFCEGSDGSVYAATWNSGFVRFHDDRVDVFSRAEGLPTDETRAIYVDRDNRVWLGLRGRGLALWENGRIWNPDLLSQRLADHVSAIAEDSRGQFWLGTPAGVKWVAKRDLLAAYRGQKDVADVRVGQVNGSLRSASVWSGPQTVVCATKDGKLLFATRDGILAVDPRNFPNSSAPPPVYVERAMVDGRPMDLAALQLAPGVKSLTIDYTAPNFTRPAQVLFKYRLEGYDTDWVEAQTRRTAYYTNLPPGRFVFRVTASTDGIVWSESGARLSVVQRPYFHQTRWFILLVAALVLAAGLAVNRWWHHRLTLRLELLEQKQALEKERRRIAKNLHDDLGANLTEIGLSTDALRQKAPPELARGMTALLERVRALAGTLDAIVWSANPANDSLDRLSMFVCGLFQDLCGMAGIRCRIDQPMPIPACPLSPDERSNLFLTIREAMTNIAKHSRAKEAWLHLRMDGATFELRLDDDGCGFDLAAAAAGVRNGLKNMRSRVAELRGTFLLESRPGYGTSLVIRVPMHNWPVEVSPIESNGPLTSPAPLRPDRARADAN